MNFRIVPLMASGAAVFLLSGCLAYAPYHLATVGNQIASEIVMQGMASGQQCRQHRAMLYQSGMTPAAAQAELARLGCAGPQQAGGASVAQPAAHRAAPVLARSDPFVAEIQSRLNDAGYDAGAVDGRLGPRTTGAIKAFQKDKGFPEDGLPTPGLLRELDSPKAPSAVAKTTNTVNGATETVAPPGETAIQTEETASEEKD